jgi:hypothetical protein
MDEPLLAYRIASADMRYIEIGERLVFLRDDPISGPVLRGELAGCGSDCYIDLSQLFLEYALSCEGCRDHLAAEEEAARFGTRLGKLITIQICPEDSSLLPDARLHTAFHCIFSSMKVPYTVVRTTSQLRYTLARSPIHEAATDMGLSRAVLIASRALYSLIKSLVRFMAPEWELLKLTDEDWIMPLCEVVVARTN